MFMFMLYVWLAGAAIWVLGFFVCCALVVTAPIGALLSWHWARRHGWDASRCARLGALYWACGLVPWVHYAFQINGRMLPWGLLGPSYAALFLAWLLGPIGIGFLFATGPLILVPIANLLAFIAALVCLMFADDLPETQERVQIRHVIPSLLGSLAMLTYLTYIPFA